MLDTHQLNIFLKASETLNFTQAAKLLHLTQPSVSQHIQSLENHFDTQLFFRTGSKLLLTDAGMALIPMAREMINHSNNINETMSSLQGEIYGNLLMGCSTTPSKYILPRLLAQFHHQYPKVSVTCQVTPQLNALEMLCNGIIQFTLTGIARKSCEDVEFYKFFCDHVLLIAPPDHPWAEQGKIQINDLHNAKFILREEESGTYQIVREALGNIDIDINKLNTLITMGNSEAIALTVEEGLGVGFVSQSVVAGKGKGRIQVIEVEGLEIYRDIYFGRLNKRPYSKAQNAFWDFITSISMDQNSIPANIQQLIVPTTA